MTTVAGDMIRDHRVLILSRGRVTVRALRHHGAEGGYPILTSRAPSDPAATPRRPAWLPAALIAALLASAPLPAAPGPRETPSKSVRLAYRFAAGRQIRQTVRQAQRFLCESRPERGGESIVVSHTVGRVIEVDSDGTALIDETTTFDAEPERSDRRRVRTRPSGEILWVDIVQGDPAVSRGGAIFLDRAVRPGERWTTKLKGAGGSPAVDLPLTITLRSLGSRGGEEIATLALEGRIDSSGVNTMIGESGAAEGIVGKECKVTGEIVLRIEPGEEVSSRIDLNCALEILEEGKAPAPATLTLSYETFAEDSAAPSIPAP